LVTAGLTACDPKSDLRQPRPNVRSGPKADRLLCAIETLKRTFASTQSRGSSRPKSVIGRLLSHSRKQTFADYTNVENGLELRRYWTTACRTCAIKSRCTTGEQRRITRWEHEHVLEAVQRRLDQNPQAMRQRRETVEHPFGTIKARMGATHFLMKTLPRVGGEMAVHVLAYNLTRVVNIIGTKPLIAANRA
jgi:hypothetical protein